ncbi:GntG family PLP-dependent aldolase [Tissierella sp. Yu-01]|uniref:threonine aldolase family protein n=1 Tax=Tissierella sp. Yu-01 TaxID=3035694 RepID=UPI00240D6C5E|nr:GntG family PLP-dependent aldolase [Tissierella sp. Yu-01]WFA08569.1 GntG family PLP-dependent aldolase [Tissierella sp. Yu-01]
MKYLDLRSDTVTAPSEEMRDAMRNAIVGDDVLGDDPTVKVLEKMGAELFGKEDCLLTVSGTMSNQIAVLSLTSRGDQIIVHDMAHIYNLELAGLALISGVQPRVLKAIGGKYNLEELKENIITKQIQTSPTTLICMENTFNLNQGLVVGKDHIDEVCKIAHSHGIPVYMDGARILNAASSLNMEVDELCENIDVVSLCLSKGLGCPIGSLLAGPKEVVAKARRMRQMLGGGWRQAGVIAAAGIVGLENWKEVIAADHKKAQVLANGLADLGLKINQVQTNIINIGLEDLNITASDFCNRLLELGVKAKEIGPYNVRMICHKDIELQDLDRVLDSCKKLINVYEVKQH